MSGRSAPIAAALSLALLLAPLGFGSCSVAAADAPQPDGGTYLDDRSSAEQVVASYYNAINQQEYARAYSYWEPEAPELPAFGDFAQGYADAASVTVTMGTITGGVAAGNLYWRVSVTLVATMTDGTMQTFAGCYQLHLGNPHVQAQPPYQPIAIQHASVLQVDNGANTDVLSQQACARV